MHLHKSLQLVVAMAVIASSSYVCGEDPGIPDLKFWNATVNLEDDSISFVLIPRRLVAPRTDEDLVRMNVGGEIGKIIAVPFDEFLTAVLTSANYPEELNVSEKQKEGIEVGHNAALNQLGHIAELIHEKKVSDREIKREAHKFVDQLKVIKSEIFLDFQLERLEQLRFAVMLQEQSLIAILGSKMMRERFSIRDDQINAMKTNKPRLETEFETEIYELREKYRDRLLEDLTPDQRKKLRQLTGAPPRFTADTESWIKLFKQWLLRL